MVVSATRLRSDVLRGVDDRPRAIGELRRVLRPGGRLMFMEHVRSDDLHLAKRQDRFNPVNRFVMCCDCNRPTLDTIRSGGFELTELEQTELTKAPPT
jgi:ubiquinone/menaquinone biosynthesis C-methylase UbiE